MRAMVGNGNDNFASIPPIKNPADDNPPSTTQIADIFFLNSLTPQLTFLMTTQFLNHTFSPTSKIAPQTTSTPCSPHPN
jgi:hypothetical protein